MSYIQGQLVRLSAAFTDAAGEPTDPDTITLKYRRPSSSTTVSVTHAAAQVVKDSTGNYHYDLNLDAVGGWLWRWEGTGDAQSAAQGTFMVAQALL